MVIERIAAISRSLLEMSKTRHSVPLDVHLDRAREAGERLAGVQLRIEREGPTVERLFELGEALRHQTEVRTENVYLPKLPHR